jgi:hypothetical protein
MFPFLNVIPDKLVLQPCELLLSELWIVNAVIVDGEPLSAFAQTTVSMSLLEAACATFRSRFAMPDFTSAVPGAVVGHDRYDCHARFRGTLRAAPAVLLR